jgi:hypothetical protein
MKKQTELNKTITSLLGKTEKEMESFMSAERNRLGMTKQQHMEHLLSALVQTIPEKDLKQMAIATMTRKQGLDLGLDPKKKVQFLPDLT